LLPLAYLLFNSCFGCGTLVAAQPTIPKSASVQRNCPRSTAAPSGFGGSSLVTFWITSMSRLKTFLSLPAWSRLKAARTPRDSHGTTLSANLAIVC